MANKGNVTVKIVGMEKLYKKLDKMESDIVGPCARRFLERSAIIVQTAASENAPTDRGWLRNDINYQIDGAPLPRWAKVGTGMKTKAYAEGVEKGTKPHWPPPGPLAAWMTRKGMDPGLPREGSIYRHPGEFGLARKIARVGTKAQPFLGPALKSNRTRINKLLALMADEVEAAAEGMR